MTSRDAVPQLSRRALLPLAGAVVLSPVMPARLMAQDADWQVYRREDLGFEVEMPGKPKLSEDKSVDGWTTVDAQVAFASMLFAAAHQIGPAPMSIPEYLRAQRMASRTMGLAVVREVQFTINGFPGLEFVAAGDVFSQAIRAVVMGNATVALLVNGDRAHEHPAARRFLASLKLLRTAP
jgi:hypothetical protein